MSYNAIVLTNGKWGWVVPASVCAAPAILSENNHPTMLEHLRKPSVSIRQFLSTYRDLWASAPLDRRRRASICCAAQHICWYE